MDSDLVLKTRGRHGDASRAAERYCGCGGMVDRVCGRCRTVGICRFVDLVTQRIGIGRFESLVGWPYAAPKNPSRPPSLKSHVSASRTGTLALPGILRPRCA